MSDWVFASFTLDNSQNYSEGRLPQGFCMIGPMSTIRRPQGAKNV